MSACSWGGAHKADFEKLYRDDRWSLSYVDELRSTAALPVHEPPQLAMDALKSMAVGTGSGRQAEVPEWLRWMCAHRVLSDLLVSMEAEEGGRGGPLRLLQVHLRHAEPQVGRIDGG